MSGRKRDKSTVIIRREEVVGGGHHGGAWKVAYADFVTAMMAFFLLMWLLNATTQEQKRGLADYFSPTNNLATATSGSGAPLGGRTPNSDGAMTSDRGAIELTKTQPYPVTDDDDTGEIPTQLETSKVAGAANRPNATDSGARSGRQVTESKSPKEGDKQAESERFEKRAFEQAAAQIRETVAADPALADVAKQLAIDITPEGLRIQLLDADRTPMFSSGSSSLNEKARAVLARIAPVLMKMPESLTIAGHTDSTPYRGTDKTNWDLSADRANATRRLLVEAGLPETRVRSVTGNADRDPLITSDPMAAANRRIAIVLLRDRAAAKR